MADIGKCKSVLADLEKASDADRKLDEAIHQALGLHMKDFVHRGRSINEYTGSLDATVALVKRVLPGWAWSVFDDGHAWLWPDQKRDLLAGFQARASTTPIALLTTMLRALIAQMEKADD